MPLLVGGTSYTQLPDTGVNSGNWWIKRQSPGRPTATWYDPDGAPFHLMNIWHNGPGYFTMDGPAGWGAAPIELVTDPYPRGGEQVRFIRTKPRRIQWPLYVGGDSYLEFCDNYRTIMGAFTRTTSRRAPGTLEIRKPDGNTRRIQAFYEQGFEGEAGENWLWAKPTITLFCPDGYFTGSDTITIGQAASGEMTDPQQKNFIAPFITLTESPALTDDGSGEYPVLNPGDVDAWPTWRLTGPFTGFTATNNTSGLRFGFTRELAAGESVTITTNPATVRSGTGLNWSGSIDWFNTLGTALWPVLAGRNSINVQIDGAGAGASVTATFQPRFEAC